MLLYLGGWLLPDLMVMRNNMKKNVLPMFVERGKMILKIVR